MACFTPSMSSVRRFAAALLLTFATSMALAEADPNWAPALNPMDAVPAISAPDAEGRERSLDSLAGENGLIFLFVRSSDW